MVFKTSKSCFPYFARNFLVCNNNCWEIMTSCKLDVFLVGDSFQKQNCKSHIKLLTARIVICSNWPNVEYTRCWTLIRLDRMWGGAPESVP